MHALTAAHRTLPFNTRVLVVNRTNGRSVVVRVNDRGPFKDNRVIDLSLKAAMQLELVAQGTAPVSIEIIELGSSGD
jgi:rare lipoprotein A